MDKQQDMSRRAFVKKAAYVTPAILTLVAAPAYAKAGSIKPDNSPTERGKGNEQSSGNGGREEHPPTQAKKDDRPQAHVERERVHGHRERGQLPSELTKMGAEGWQR